MSKKNKFILKANYPIVLASQSEIRKKILLDTGLVFKQVSSKLNEKEMSKSFKYKSVVNLSRKLAQEKALLVSKKNYNGDEHKQISSVCLCYKEKVIWSYTETVYLRMRKLSVNLIKLYVDIDMPLNSCGAYKYESQGKYLFSEIKGSIDAILGLPLSPLLEILYKKKILEYA